MTNVLARLAALERQRQLIGVRFCGITIPYAALDSAAAGEGMSREAAIARLADLQAAIDRAITFFATSRHRPPAQTVYTALTCYTNPPLGFEDAEAVIMMLLDAGAPLELSDGWAERRARYLAEIR